MGLPRRRRPKHWLLSPQSAAASGRARETVNLRGLHGLVGKHDRNAVVDQVDQLAVASQQPGFGGLLQHAAIDMLIAPPAAASFNASSCLPLSIATGCLLTGQQRISSNRLSRPIASLPLHFQIQPRFCQRRLASTIRLFGRCDDNGTVRTTLGRSCDGFPQ